MFLGGWLYFRDSGNTSEIILDKEKVHQDTERAVESGEKVLEKAAGGLKKLGEKTEDALIDDDIADDEAPAEIPEEKPVKQLVDSP